MSRFRGWSTLGLAVLMLTAGAKLAHARADQAMLEEFKAGFPELFPAQWSGRVQPMAVPDIFGPGAVLDVGNIYMKVTNFDIIGNAFPGYSSDPSAQWPGASGIEYLAFILLGVGGVNSTATDPASIRRVSMQPEWRPQTLDAVDKMYRSYDGQAFGQRSFDDDEDARKADPLEAYRFVDEDFQDGRDNDGDGSIDEDFAAFGQKMWSCVMWDNTQQALTATLNEKHVPLNLELWQTAWAYSTEEFANINVIHWKVFNRSGHGLDSMYLGIRSDVDAGPYDSPTYYSDDVDLPFFPYGEFKVEMSPGDEWGKKLDPKGTRRQQNHAVIPSVPDAQALCPQLTLRVNGFTTADNDGDEGRTKGVPTILLLGHTVDPLGLMAPTRVGWSAFRSYIAGTPYASGGNPVTDQQRFELMQSNLGVNTETGFIEVTPVDQEGDIQTWAVVGPFGVTDAAGVAHPIPDGGSIEITIAFVIEEGNVVDLNQYPADYQAYVDGRLTMRELFNKYPTLRNAFAAQVAYEGVYGKPPDALNDAFNINTPDFHGRETRLRAPQGFILSGSDCRDEGSQRQINEFAYTWFDFDCDYCTGVWVFGSGPGGGTGQYLRRWNTQTPPPNPNLNTAAEYNFRDNPDRIVTPSGDGRVVLAWDNLSEVTADPSLNLFDFRAYRLWKASNWTRPVGASGPSDNDWALIGDFRFFDYADSNKEAYADSVMDKLGFWPPARDSVHAGQAICPQVFIPNVALQTLVLSKSRFADKGVASAWIQSFQDSLPQSLHYNVSTDMTDDVTSGTWRFRQLDGECKTGTLRTVDLRPGVVAEVCQNPLADTLGFKVPICLYRGDLWDHQSGEIVRVTPSSCTRRAPDGTCLVDTIACVKSGLDCRQEKGKPVDAPGEDAPDVYRTVYKVGRYRFVDQEVKNGFLYFYSVTAVDSSNQGTQTTDDDESEGRRSAVEAETVVPQAGTRQGRQVWVVPNPYRGYSELARRPSSWDLTPNATDPTGTHVDFLGLPPGAWTIQIFTVSGDLVQVLRSTDQVNESVRGPAVVRNPNFNPNLPPDPLLNPETITVPGYNRQQDNPNDGQARWNLISRNGQDVVSGVYLFVVESEQGTQRGKFVIIR